MLIKMNCANGGGGGASDTGTFTIPINNIGSPITVPLPFTPSFVEVRYDAYDVKSTKLIGSVSSDDGSFAIDVYGTGGGIDRLVLGLTTNGFTVEFSAANADIWQYTDAEYIAYQ